MEYEIGVLGNGNIVPLIAIDDNGTSRKVATSILKWKSLPRQRGKWFAPLLCYVQGFYYVFCVRV